MTDGYGPHPLPVRRSLCNYSSAFILLPKPSQRASGRQERSKQWLVARKEK